MKTLLLVTLGTFVSLLGSVNAASDPRSTANQVSEQILGQLFNSKGRPKSPNQISLTRLRDTMGQTLNWEVMVKRAMGRSWTKVSPAEQKKIVDLTSLLIVKTYTDQLSSVKGRPKVKCGAFKKRAGNRASLPCVIDFGGNRVSAMYHYINSRGRWICYDMSVEGASLVNAYRSQFDSHFRRGNGAQMIAKLHRKVSN